MNVSSREPDFNSKTRLDSHAITPVVGYNTYVWKDTGKTVNVGGFTKALGSLKAVPVVDAIVVYECPYSNQSYLLMIYNALYVAENPDNYISPFHIREAGVSVDTTAKLHCDDPCVDNHSMFFKEEGLRVHFNLDGIVSYFNTRKPTKEEIETLPSLDITPDLPAWDPYDTKYERMEDIMLDYEGNIIPEKERKSLLDFDNDGMDVELQDVDFPVQISAVFQSICENMELALGEEYIENRDALFRDQVIGAVNPIYDEYELANALNDRCTFSKFAMSVGSMTSEPDFVIGASHHDKPKGITPERLAEVF